MNFCLLLGLCLFNLIYGRYLLVDVEDQQAPPRIEEPKSPAPACIPPKGKCFTKTKISISIEFSARSVKGPAECCEGYACVSGMCLKPRISIDGLGKMSGIDELQGTRDGHLSGGKAMVDELLSREFQCNFNEDCEEKFPETPICNNGRCFELTTTPEPGAGPVTDSMNPPDNPYIRCESDEDCLSGFECKPYPFVDGNICKEVPSGNGCQWFGTAPICDGECPQEMSFVRRSYRGDGAPCLTGSKAYCCSE